MSRVFSRRIILNSSFITRIGFSSKTLFAVLLCLFFAVGLTACGSTKVYTADKTLTHSGTLYNLSGVKAFTTEVWGNTDSGEKINLKNADKKRFNSVVDEHGPLSVETLIMLDERELVYERRTIKSSSDFQKMVKRLESAASKISKFMADKKKTQLKL
jgi:hypothetical protein